MKKYLLIIAFALLNVQLTLSQTTQLIPASCGVTLNTMQDDLFVTAVPGATNYQYHVTNAALGFEKYYNRGSGSTIFRLGWINGVLYNQTYNVEVRPYVNGSWGSWGNTCTVTTPANVPSTKLSNAYCGITLSQLSDLLYCDIISGATNYEYRITNASTGFSQIYLRGSGSNAFSLSWVNGIQINTTYDVEVRANVNGTWGNFGIICQVTTPMLIPLTQLDANSCGKILSSINEIVYCNQIQNATNYEYKITNASLGFNTNYLRNSSSNAFSLSWVNGISYGYTYDIEVRSYVNGTWSSYGQMCQLTVPSIPATQINSSLCGTTLTDAEQVIYVDPVVGATNYEYKITNTSINYNTSYFRNSSSNAFSLSWVPGIVHGHAYQIQVRAYVNNTWGNFGNICELTAIPKIKMQPAYCGIQVSNITDWLYTTIVPNATKYEYNVYNDSLGINKIYIRNIQNTCCPSIFALNMMNGIMFDTPYKIRVRTQINNIWGLYGESCNLMSPNFSQTSFVPNDCGIVLNNNSQLLSVTPVYNASNYEYSITEPVTGWKKTYYRGSGSWLFSMSWINGILPSTTYEITVKAFSNGTWGPTGPMCTVTTASSLRINKDAENISDNTDYDLQIYPNPITNLHELSFKFISDEALNTNSRWCITTIKGEVIYEGNLNVEKIHDFKLPTNVEVTSGIYILKLFLNNKVYNKKFTVL